MEDLVSKGMRLKKTRSLNVPLRGEVYDWLISYSLDLKCGPSLLVRGLIEDFYDQHKHDPAPAGPGKEVQE